MLYCSKLLKRRPHPDTNKTNSILAKMFQVFKTNIKRTVLAALPFIVIFVVVTLTDVLLQRDVRSQLEQSFENPFTTVLSYTGFTLKWALLLTVPALFLGRRARFIYYVLWPYLVLVETIEIVTRLSYGMVLDGDWLMIVSTSSAQEFREFFGQFSWSGILFTVLGFLTALCVGLFFFRRVRYPIVSKSSAIAAFLSFAPFVVCNLILSNPLAAGNEVLYMFLPIDTVHNYAMYADISRTANEPRLPKNTLADQEHIQETLGVFVIGESATRTHWHLYGYDRPTTPMMESVQKELVVFKDVRAIHSTTGKSLRMLLTEATLEKPRETRSTFSQQCSAAGYTCALFSGQSHWGRWEGVEPLLFTGCATKYYLRERTESAEVFDDALLLPAEKAVRSGSASGQIVFFHLMGSHAPPLFRYPGKRAIYPRYPGDVAPGVDDPDSFAAYKADLYDNTIAFTDLILGKIIDMIKAQHRPSFLVYLSDHGETPSSSNWRDVSSSDMWTVPFIVWFSSEYRVRYPETVAAVAAMADEPRRLDQILPIFRVLVHLDNAESLK